MKKIILAIISIFLLTACSNNNSISLDIDATSNNLDNEMQKMLTLTDKELEVIYGLDLSLMKNYIIKYNSSKNGYLYAIIEIDSNNKDKVKKQMNNLFDVLKTQSNLYSPKAVEILDNRLETSVGNYLIYISYKDTSKAYELVKENIK